MFQKFQKKQDNNFILNFSLVLILVFGLFYILYIGQSLIIPFIISILFSFAILGLSNFYKKFRIPAFFAMILSISTYFLIFYFIYLIIHSNINELISLAPTYQNEIIKLVKGIIDYFGFDRYDININKILEFVNFQNIFNYVLFAVSTISGSIGTILFYTIFILLESIYFERKLGLMIGDVGKRAEIKQVLSKIEKDIKGYFFIKTVVSFLTAFVSYIIMYSFGLDFAAFWALLVFILNFIPNIGSIIAVIFPSILSFIQVGFSPYASFAMIIFLTIVQMVVGNIVEPKMMGNRLNLSPLVIIIALSFWGFLWGIVGMLLSVPLVVIMNIILSKFEQTRPIAIFLSEKGDLEFFENNTILEEKRGFLNRFLKK